MKVFMDKILWIDGVGEMRERTIFAVWKYREEEIRSKTLGAGVRY